MRVLQISSFVALCVSTFTLHAHGSRNFAFVQVQRQIERERNSSTSTFAISRQSRQSQQQPNVLRTDEQRQSSHMEFTEEVESEQARCERRAREYIQQKDFEKRFPLHVQVCIGQDDESGRKQYRIDPVESINFGAALSNWKKEFGQRRYYRVLSAFYEEVKKSPFKYDESVLINYGNSNVGLALLSESYDYHFHAVEHLYRLHSLSI